MARTSPPRTRLPFAVSVMVRHHANGTVTAQVVGAPDLVSWGPDLDALREDLALAVLDRIERSHPARLAGWQAPRGRALREVDVPAVVELLDEAPILRAARIPVLEEPEGTWVRGWLPTLDARIWVEAGQDVDAAVCALVERLLRDADTGRRLRLRTEGGTSLLTLELEAELAPLVLFTGERLGHGLLPVPEPDDPDAKDADGKPKIPTPTLDAIAIPLHAEGHALTVAHGRDAEIAELLRLLARPGAAVVVIGPPTSGKSAVLDGLARALTRPAWYADASRLVDADLFTGWRQQTVDAAQELADTEAVWFVGDPIDLLDAGKHVGSEMNVAQVLKPLISAGRMRVIGECSEATWGRLCARDAGFAALFTPWRLPAVPADRVRGVLDAVARDLPVSVGASGLDAALGLCARYGPPDALLGATCHFLRRLAGEARARGLSGPLDREDAIARFCAETGMPELLVRDELPLDPAALEAWFGARLVGQAEAVRHLVDLVAVIKGGMSDLGRPLGSFLFVGPTGVGKTEASKALASWMFGDPGRLVRFDMSEFAGPDCLIRLLDPSSGLVARVRRSPFCVVLLDEIEKAHPAVSDLLLQVLGEARLTDPDGHTADFRNAVILMTSNLGVGTYRRPTGFGADPAASLQAHVLGEVERAFRPELFNRIDRVVPFASLGAAAITGIAGRELDAVVRREGLKGRGVQVEVDPEVVPWLAERGVDVALGARPLKRAVTTHLVAPLARHLAGRGTPPRVRIAVGSDGLTFANADADGRVASHERLRALWTSLGVLRHRAELWRRSATVRDASHELRLVDRLMAGKRFWADANAARTRAEALEGIRAAVQAHTDAHELVLAVEELAQEAWIARDASRLDALTEQRDEAERALTDAELQIAGTRFPRPDRARLELAPEEGSEDFGRRLAIAYLHIGAQFGWSMKVRQGTDGRWEPIDDVELTVKRTRNARDGHPWGLTVEGRHAAAVLLGEAGVHAVKDARAMRVAVRVGSGDLVSSPAVLRVFDVPKDQVREAATKVTTTLHNRLERPMLALIRLGILRRHLGDEVGERLWRGTDGFTP